MPFLIHLARNESGNDGNTSNVPQILVANDPIAAGYQMFWQYVYKIIVLLCDERLQDANPRSSSHGLYSAQGAGNLDIGIPVLNQLLTEIKRIIQFLNDPDSHVVCQVVQRQRRASMSKIILRCEKAERVIGQFASDQSALFWTPDGDGDIGIAPR